MSTWPGRWGNSAPCPRCFSHRVVNLGPASTSIRYYLSPEHLVNGEVRWARGLYNEVRKVLLKGTLPGSFFPSHSLPGPRHNISRPKKFGRLLFQIFPHHKHRNWSRWIIPHQRPFLHRRFLLYFPSEDNSPLYIISAGPWKTLLWFLPRPLRRPERPSSAPLSPPIP